MIMKSAHTLLLCAVCLSLSLFVCVRPPTQLPYSLYVCVWVYMFLASEKRSTCVYPSLFGPVFVHSSLFGPVLPLLSACLPVCLSSYVCLVGPCEGGWAHLSVCVSVCLSDRGIPWYAKVYRACLECLE